MNQRESPNTRTRHRVFCLCVFREKEKKSISCVIAQVHTRICLTHYNTSPSMLESLDIFTVAWITSNRAQRSKRVVELKERAATEKNGGNTLTQKALDL